MSDYMKQKGILHIYIYVYMTNIKLAVSPRKRHVAQASLVLAGHGPLRAASIVKPQKRTLRSHELRDEKITMPGPKKARFFCRFNRIP